MKEFWKDIPGYKGLYQASNRGRLRSLARVVKKSNGSTQTIESRILKTPPDSEGYLQCTLFKGGVRWHPRLHQVISRTFRGKCPVGMEVCHKNGIKADCTANNLNHGTPLTNGADKVRHGRSVRGEQSHCHKLKKIDVIAIRQAYAQGGVTQKELGSLYGVSNTTIHDVVRGNKWSWV